MLSSEPNRSLDKVALHQAAIELARRESVFARTLAAYGPPPLWKRPATFATLVRIVLEQQVSLAVGKITYERLRLACGGHVTARSINLIDDIAIRQCGISRQKARYIAALSASVRSRRFSVAALKHVDDEAASMAIQSQLGFGRWSADVFLMMALLRSDIFPIGDLGLVKGVAEAFDRSFETTEEILQFAERWRPWRSVATRMIWQVYLANRGQDAHRTAKG